MDWITRSKLFEAERAARSARRASEAQGDELAGLRCRVALLEGLTEALAADMRELAQVVAELRERSGEVPF